MTQKEMEKVVKGLKDQIEDLKAQLAAFRKRVRQLEVDFYKDRAEPEEPAP
jgi:hypothetical protein